MDIDSIVAEIKGTEDYIQKSTLINKLIHDKVVTLTKLSEMLEMKPAYVCHIMRLGKLPEIIIDGYYSHVMSVTHLYIIARLNTQEEMLQVYEKVLANGFTVLQTEELVREILYGIKTEKTRLTKAEIDNFSHSLTAIDEKIQAKVIQTRIRGKLIIDIKGSTTITTSLLKKFMKKLSE
ncbi:hypothetical protein HGB07_09920 [Candidatus Roizmanbacteria bacterium]|nr:hypothetical protein [Candidatus Roizmanbacteria bacterium]